MGRKRSLENRGRILDGAAGLLSEGRYRDLTVDALAKRIGMSKSTLYKYFRDKEDLLRCMVDDAIEPVRAAIDAPESAGVERLRSLLTAWQRFGDSLPAAFFLDPGAFPAVAKKRLDEAYESMDAALRDAVERGVEDGDLRAETALIQVVVTCTARGGLLARNRGEPVELTDLIPLISA